MAVWDGNGRNLSLVAAGSSRPLVNLQSGSSLSGAAFTPDAKTLATFCNDNFVYLWNLKTGQEITRLKIPFGEFAKVQFSADGRKLAAVTFSDAKDDDNGTQYTAHVFIWSGMEGD